MKKEMPISFMKKYLNGNKQERAILRRAGKKWVVKVKGRCLEEEGWEKFVEEHDLQLGDFLVFRHEGDMEFEVSIFDSSHCEREYGVLPQQEVNETREERGHTRKKFTSQEKPKPNIKSSDKAAPHVDVAEDMPHSHSYFICTVPPYSLSRNFLSLPSQFARANNLCNRICTITVTDERRSWTFRLGPSGPTAYIGRGWHEFSVANCLKKGDRIMFEVVSNGEKPIWKFYDLSGSPSIQPEGVKNNLDAERISTEENELEKPKHKIKSSHKTSPIVEAAKDMPHRNSYFICTIKPYCLSRKYLFLPSQFALENSLSNRICTIIVIGERRSWSFKLHPSGINSCIRGGWHEFAIENSLKEGDRIMFEIVANGEKPTFKFYAEVRIKTSDSTAPKARVPTSTSPDASNPYFISTIKPYCISTSFLHLPSAFVKSNGLINRHCEMILIDEQRRSWSVVIGPTVDRFGIRSGWVQFREANGVQVGDTYKFELISNGRTPMAYFHCKYTGKDAQASQKPLTK